MSPDMIGIPKQVSKTVFVVLSLLFISGVLYFASQDSTATTTNTYVYCFMVLLPFVLAMILALRDGSLGSTMFSHAFLMYGMAAVVCSCFLVYVYNNYIGDIGKLVVDLVTKGIAALLAMFLLTTLLNVFSNHLMRIGGLPGILIRFLFFIPCLIRDGVELFMKDFATTNRVTIALLAMDLFLIVGYLLMKFVFAYVPHVLHAGINLQKDPVFLDTGVHPIASQLQVSTTLNSNYSLGMWIILNAQNLRQTQPDTNIFTYDTHVLLQFGYDPTSKQFVYKLVMKNKETYLFRLPYQRWNYFVFTLNNNHMDLFLNGQLHKSFVIDDTDTYKTSDLFAIGDTNPLQGSVANVIYYPTPLTASAIANLYNIRSHIADIGTSPLVGPN